MTQPNASDNAAERGPAPALRWLRLPFTICCMCIAFTLTVVGVSFGAVALAGAFAAFLGGIVLTVCISIGREEMRRADDAHT